MTPGPLNFYIKFRIHLPMLRKKVHWGYDRAFPESIDQLWKNRYRYHENGFCLPYLGLLYFFSIVFCSFQGGNLTQLSLDFISRSWHSIINGLSWSSVFSLFIASIYKHNLFFAYLLSIQRRWQTHSLTPIVCRVSWVFYITIIASANKSLLFFLIFRILISFYWLLYLRS